MNMRLSCLFIAMLILSGQFRVRAGYVRLYDNFATSVELEHAGTGGSPSVRSPMTNVAFGVWELEKDWPSGTNAYRFIIDGSLPVSDIGNRDHTNLPDGTVWSLVVMPDRASDNSGVPEREPSRHPVTIEYRNATAKNVRIAGEFNGWALEPMRLVRDGVWRADLHLAEGEYGYKFVVDDQWLLDPANEQRKTSDGVENSLLSVNSNSVTRGVWEAVVGEGSSEDLIPVEFTFYAPEEEHLSVVGTFNDWNGERHPMEKTGGWWRCRIDLPEGNYQYKFKAGDQWMLDPNNPYLAGGTSSGNSLLEVRHRPVPTAATPLIDPIAWKDINPILLEPSGRSHPFQQELLRAWIFIQASDGHALHVADGSLLQSGPQVPVVAGRWSWKMEMDNALPVVTISVGTNAMSFPLIHPMLTGPHAWLNELRTHGTSIIPDGFTAMNGPTSPPPESAWAEARQAMNESLPMADVFMVNNLTAFGRAHGWSRELLRDLAITYANMSYIHRYPSMGGWAPDVFAARAVVYAELARSPEATDETMSYVLSRIGRPGDAVSFIPPEPAGYQGKLADILVHGRRDQLTEVVGTPDHYGFALAEGLESIPPAMADLPGWQKAGLLHAMFELLDADEQLNMSRMYLEAALRIQPWSFTGNRQAVEKGSVSAGHRHVRTLLGLAGNIHLWESALNGARPELFDEKALVTSPQRIRSEIKQASDRELAEVSRLYREQFRQVHDIASEPVPKPVRLILLRDMLNSAWWSNARFFGRQLYSQAGCENINRLMSAWKPMQPEMDAFTRFLMRGPLNEHPYQAVREGFEKNRRGADTLEFIALVRASFGTWLLEPAQELYPHTPIIQSDLLSDYLDEHNIFVFMNMDHWRGNIRRLSPLNSRGYPSRGETPTIDNGRGVPDYLYRSSFGLNKRLAEIWNLDGNPASRNHTLDFYRRCLEIAPYETTIYRTMAGVLMDNGRFREALELVDRFPDSTEGLESTAMDRLGAMAALELGDTDRATSYAKTAADSGQGGAMLAYAYILEVTGRTAQSLSIQEAQDERYGGDDILYSYSRNDPAKAAEKATEVFSWIEQFPDLQKANDENKFSFNEFKEHAFYYGALGRWDKALWLLKPMSEAVQNDYIWLLLMTVAQKTGDHDAENLAEHVLANHVQNVFGECARFNRGTRTWSDVVNMSRIEGRPQPVFLFAAMLAEERGDVELARRLLMHAINPRFGLSGWFTMAWNEYRRLGGDPVAFALRNTSSGKAKLED
ncbi:MAG: hypothetical protein M9963_04190 [Kiritimatiellae bacterium]|nr:hypothetical protein [Kiritimatiellia bacterium]